MQIGLGFDIHRIRKKTDGYLRLAGIRIAAPYKVMAHSDGDIILHALSDAISSAIGIADIGEQFPPHLKRTEGMDSGHILHYALGEMKKRSLNLASVSIVLAAEKPALLPYRKKIQASLGATLKLPPQKIGLTFKTFEQLAPFAEKAIACWANCLIAPL